MVNEASLPLSTVFAFLMVLARVSGAFIFVPIPGMSGASQPVRVVLALSLTIALFPLWPAPPPTPSVGLLLEWLIVEAAVGLSIGLVIGFLFEAFALFGQMVGLHSGHSFASTVDPNTQADSAIFVVLAQSIAGLLFFSTGLHRNVIHVFAKSLENQPPGMYTLSAGAGDVIVRLSSTIISRPASKPHSAIDCTAMVMVDPADGALEPGERTIATPLHGVPGQDPGHAGISGGNRRSFSESVYRLCGAALLCPAGGDHSLERYGRSHQATSRCGAAFQAAARFPAG